MVIGRWVCRVSLNICSDLEEVFSYPLKLSHSCLETKEKKRRGGGGGGKEGSKKSVVEAKLVGLMDVLGLIRIRVRRGINLAVRDTLSSDPYCVVSCANQKVKTKVVRGNCNPVWNEELTIYIKDFDSPIVLSVYDKDTFTVDDSMGSAQIDIEPLIKCLKMGLQSLPDGTKVERVHPTKENCLAEESAVVWNKGKMTQDMILRLNDVECGQVQVQIEWIEIPGCKGLKV
ncbi:protein C2-DOMAIN ABA-RELATED 7-like [Salvia miltiorrhiza]|uniref:protein C2-DOMAIN ABA-RELATED 7-like n=1 Tax=Salvia miltiorrhiza TaxID=226208 RepID=UPI0025ABDF77|nr:protein C2-DOMAIN ABA-RELATED 7-like [Salvia miltiorrhiza]